MNNEVSVPRMSKQSRVEGCVNTVCGKRMHMNTHKHTHINKQTNTNWKKQIQKSKSTNRNSSSTGQTSGTIKCQSNMFSIIAKILTTEICLNDNRGRRHRMKGNDANRRDEQKGGQKNGMNSEPSWVIFIIMPCVRWGAVSLLWYCSLTWLCMNLRLIPSSVTCSSPPSPVFMSWTGNSPPSSGPEGNHNWVYS